MENAKEECCLPPSPKAVGAAGGGGEGPAVSADQNRNPNPMASDQPARRTSFANLNQVDADLALARALQEQERAYMMLRRGVGGIGGSEYGSSNEDYEDDSEEHEVADQPEEDGKDDYGEEDVDGGGNGDINPEDFEDDEAYARALQEAEGRGIVARLMALAGLNEWPVEHVEDDDTDAQDAWEDVDPDELSYEELIALGEVVGTESRGLSADTIASLPSINYEAEGTEDGNTDQCVICRLDYEDGESLVVLSCMHLYHPDCINRWLEINKVCPVCNKEVTTSDNRQE